MCDWCIRHGQGKKWYLEKRNFVTKELFNEKKEIHDSLEWYLQNAEKSIALDMAKAAQYLPKPVIGRIVQRVVRKKIKESHQGQIIPIEEAASILNISSSAAIVSCVCRRMQLGKIEKCCVVLDYFTEYIKEWPDYTRGGIDYVAKEEALKVIESYMDKGYVASIWGYPIPFIGALCICEYPVCTALKIRLDYGYPTIMRKAEFVVEKDNNSCTDCGTCIDVCQFGAMKRIKTLDRTVLDVSKCFGCGLCTRVCPENALKLVPRETVPAVMGEW